MLKLLRLDGQAIIPAVIFAASALVGLLAGQTPGVALVGTAAIVAALIAVSSVTVSVAAFTVMSMTFLGARPHLMLGAAFAVGLAWLANLTLTRRARVRSLATRHLGLLCMLFAFVTWIGLTQLWAPDVQAVRQTAERYAVLLVLFPAVFAVAQSRRGAKVVLGAIALGATLSAMMAIVGIAPYPASTGSIATPYGSRLVGGPVGDPNIFAALALAGGVLAFGLASRKVGLATRWRWIFALSGVICLSSVGASGSRGAIIAMVAMVGALPFLTQRRPARSVAFAVAVAGLAVILATASWSPMAQRLQDEGLNSSGRVELWKIGWAMAKDHPIGGVGAGNFRQVSVNYLLRVGSLAEDTYVVDRPLVVHNSYLQLAAESGVVGLALFVGIVLACFACAVKAQHAFAARGDPGMAVLASALILALAGMLGALFFVSFLDYGRPLFVMLALGPALLALAAANEDAARLARQPVRFADSG